MLTADKVQALEKDLEAWNAGLAPLKEFILPGGTRAAAATHLARAVCRRAERSVVALGRTEPVSPLAGQYLNRLSDLLFVGGRWLNKQAGRGDVQWHHQKAKK
jgi:cob(I)alamin adenosyltransferase